MPFPNQWISSESSLAISVTAPNQLMAAFLGVHPQAEKPEYQTVILHSYNHGKSWTTENRIFSNQAADPWLVGTNTDEFVFSDISEGNDFHLKTWSYKDGLWNSALSHGLGHDHTTLITDRNTDFLFSTQRKTKKKLLYVSTHVADTLGFRSKSIELFNGCDFSVKKPVLLKNHIAIPVVLRGSLNGESAQNFRQMTSWLFLLDRNTFTISAPELITTKSGGKHHILVNGNEELYYCFTDMERKRLEVIKKATLDVSWSLPKTITSSEHLVNLDAAIWHNNSLVVIYTKETKPGHFQKYILVISKDLAIGSAIKLGPESVPDSRNGWALRAWPQGGDYCGLVASSNKLLYVVWSAAPDGLFKPYFSQIQLP